MVEEEEIVSKDCYYKEKPDDSFFNYSIHGLNIEGIKKYYSIPVNSRYNYMVKINKDLKELLENSKKKQNEREKKYDINNRYDEERLLKMYSIRKEDNKNENIKNNNKNHYNTIGNISVINNDISKSSKILERKKTIEKSLPIRLNKNGIDNKIDKKDLRENLLNKNIFIKNSNDNSKINYSIGKYSNSFNKKNRYISLKHYNRNKIDNKEVSLPFIKPRKVIIEYNLTNDAGVEDINKNFGHNNYMGISYDPYNYSIKSKNRNKRNVNGALFIH